MIISEHLQVIIWQIDERYKHFLKQTLGEVMIKSQYRGKFRILGKVMDTELLDHKSGGGETFKHLTTLMMMMVTSLAC